MRRLIPNALVISALLLASVREAGADTLAYEPFSYSLGSNISGQNGGTGFFGGWDVGSYTQTVSVTSGLSYPGLPVAGNGISETTAPTIPAGIWRNTAFTFGNDNTTLYFSFLMQLGNGNSYADYSGLSFGNAFIGYNLSRYPGQGFQISDDGGNNAVGTGIIPVAGETYLLVMKAQFLPGNDRFTLWVDPTLNGAEPSGGLVNTQFDAGQGLNVVSWQYSGSQHVLDEIRIGTTFADVTSAAPLPAAANAGLLLLGIVGLGQIVRRRRREKLLSL